MLLLSLATAAVPAIAAIHYRKVAKDLETCPVFGCYTRPALERRQIARGAVVIFGDIDGMKGLNSALGHDEVNRLIRQALAECRRSVRATDVYRYFSGDELVFIAKECRDGGVICDRIQSCFQRQGLSITLAWGVVGEDELRYQIAKLGKQVQLKKVECANV